MLVLENNLQAFISPKFGLEVVEDKRNFMEIWFVICCLEALSGTLLGP